MKLSRKMFVSAAAVFLAATVTASTVFSSKISDCTVSPSGDTAASLQNVFDGSVKPLASDSSKTLAHGVTLNTDGTFDFTVDGVTYKNEYERILAEDGFIYGIDYNRFGTYAQYAQGLGFNEITGKKSVYKPEYVERSLYNLKALGLPQ